MNSILVIDDLWEKEGGVAVRQSPDCQDALIIGFSDVSGAIKYLETISPEQYPDTCIVDAISSLLGMGIPSVNLDSGLKSALELERFYNQHKCTGTRFIFKSENAGFAMSAQTKFKEIRPDTASGIMTRHNAYLQIEKQGYTPPSIPEVTQAFMRKASELHPMYVFENLRGEPLRHLYNVWNEIADVKAKGHETSIEFDYADGPPKTGIIVRSINDLKSIPYGKKAILIAERFPEDVLQYAHNIAAIIIEKNDEMASHIRFIMKPLGISIMAGAIHPIPVDLSGEITVHPLAKKLYLEPVNIIDMGQGMSRMNTYIKEMSAVARHLCERTSMHLPHFRTNISGQEHRDDTLFVGLTRTEQFLSPYVDATAFSKLREFLIGRGADLREIFAKAGDKYGHIPFVQNKRKSYESEFRLVAPLPTRVSQFEPEDVLRLLDIPAEEFFWAEDLKKFKNLYGNARGVKLARLVPDLYIMQLRNLERFGKFHQDGPPFILIPAVDCADDVHFVQHCAEKALPARIFRMMSFGAMIDSNLACKNVGDIATSVSHISIGSNDLTADVLGISRQNPENAHQFTSLPKDLIPVLSELVKNAREANPRITISLCGEAAADIHSILALEEAGIFIDYFSAPSTYKDARLLPLIYADMKSEKFCGPLKEDEMTFRLPPRESEYAPR